MRSRQIASAKSGNFGHQVHVNSDKHLQTAEIQMRQLTSHRGFHCLLSYFLFQ